jgi:hypothetical protein
MFRVEKLNLILYGVPKWSVRQIVEEADQANNRAPLVDETGQSPRRNLGRFREARPEWNQLVGTIEVGGDGGDELVHVVENSDHVMQAGMRGIYEDPVGHPKLPEAVQALHRRRVQYLELSAR